MFEVPSKIKSLMRDFKPDWFVAGGWAIDLFHGKITRKHADIEIAVFRQDQFALQNYLKDWTLKKAINGTLLEWNNGEFLELPMHAIHCFNEKYEPSFLEVLFNEYVNNEWIYRRNKEITKPLSELYAISESGVKFLRPEVVLLYKSKNPRTKDDRDFENTVKFMSPESRVWLKEALLADDCQHRWLQQF